MPGKMDEFTVHQAVLPLAQVASDDPHWQDRLYFNLHGQDGAFLAITGMGAFPNRGTREGYLLAVHRGRHYASFVSRPLAGDREEMTAGGLSFAVVEPLRSWRLQLTPEGGRVRGHLLFEARCPAYDFETIRWQKGEATVVHQCHYTQAGRYLGVLEVDGQALEGLMGMRDRSWGIRNLAQVDMWLWASVQLPDACITAWQWETAAGERIYCDGALVREDGQVRRIVSLAHRLELWPASRRHRRTRLALRLEDGQELELLAEEVASVYLGRQPSEWSDDDEETRHQADAAALGYDQLCHFRGEGVEGWGVLEFALVGGYRPYGIAPARLG